MSISEGPGLVRRADAVHLADMFSGAADPNCPKKVTQLRRQRRPHLRLGNANVIGFLIVRNELFLDIRMYEHEDLVKP